MVVQTSPNNFQAWVKHPEVLDKETSTAAARALAQRFGGDPGAADWRHFGRLSGYTNRKDKYKGSDGLYPFVRLMESSGTEYEKGKEFLTAVRTQTREGPRGTSPDIGSGAIAALGEHRSIEGASTSSAPMPDTAATERGWIWPMRFMRFLMGLLKRKSLLHYIRGT